MLASILEAKAAEGRKFEEEEEAEWGRIRGGVEGGGGGGEETNFSPPLREGLPPAMYRGEGGRRGGRGGGGGPSAPFHPDHGGRERGREGNKEGGREGGRVSFVCAKRDTIWLCPFYHCCEDTRTSITRITRMHPSFHRWSSPSLA